MTTLDATSIDHVNMAVNNLDESVLFYSELCSSIQSTHQAASR